MLLLVFLIVRKCNQYIEAFATKFTLETDCRNYSHDMSDKVIFSISALGKLTRLNYIPRVHVKTESLFLN